MNRSLALAALDPDAAIAAAARAPAVTPIIRVAPTPDVREDRPLALLKVEVEQRPISRWRFFIFWLLIKLAARVCGFKFEINAGDDQ